jgi:hypothetical protein
MKILSHPQPSPWSGILSVNLNVVQILWEKEIFAFAQKLGHANPLHVATTPLL